MNSHRTQTLRNSCVRHKKVSFSCSCSSCCRSWTPTGRRNSITGSSTRPTRWTRRTRWVEVACERSDGRLDHLPRGQPDWHDNKATDFRVTSETVEPQQRLSVAEDNWIKLWGIGSSSGLRQRLEIDICLLNIVPWSVKSDGFVLNSVSYCRCH